MIFGFSFVDGEKKDKMNKIDDSFKSQQQQQQ